MKLKTLLLSSAAAFMVVGGAQAADLSIAEPVDYVKVCDAFGAGYWYIPGSDTCLKIGGLVRADVNFHSTAATSWGTSSTSAHSASWDFATEARLNVTTKSMTESGAQSISNVRTTGPTATPSLFASEYRRPVRPSGRVDVARPQYD